MATAPGPAGVALLRVSGPNARAIARKLFARPPKRARHAVLRDCLDPDTDEILDSGLVIIFRAPASYTGEDVLEFHGHGGSVAPGRILDAALRAGATLAQPGEFTKRAFLNGKLDLAQAEAVADMIAAGSVDAHRAALRQAGGALGDAIAGLRALLLETLARVEATIDFPEDVGELDIDLADASLADFAGRADAILSSATYGKRLQSGVPIALIGPTNAGKSSLLNALAGADRAIVTPIAGTTRDLLREPIDIDGVPVTALDTAGLRATDDPIESEGIARARAAAANADTVLLVLDATRPDEIPAIPPEWRDRLLILINKCDLCATDTVRAALSPELSLRPIVDVSAHRPSTIAALRREIADQLGARPGTETPLIAHVRQENGLRRAAESVALARRTLKESADPALIAVDLFAALSALGEITGETRRDDIIDGIFSRFCIGK